MKYPALIGLALALLWATAAGADDLTAHEVTDIIRSLAPTADAPVVAGSTQVETKRVVVNNTIIFVDPAHSLDFEVYFPFDSAAITPQARMQLETLGEALESRALRKHAYLIAGHTDAQGSAAYNLDLSARRAISVRRFLVESFAIDPSRLVAVGFGESQLKTPEAPFAGINRRVEVALILSRQP